MSVKYKIQVPSVNGWADLKTSEDGGAYEVELFYSWEAGEGEGVSLQPEADGDSDPFEYRVVPSHVEPDDDLYEGSPELSAEDLAASIVAEIAGDEQLMVCRTFAELHDHCDANVLGDSELVLGFREGLENNIALLNEAQSLVNDWLQIGWEARRINGLKLKCDTDKNVECHSAAFFIVHGYSANWNTNEDVCDELWSGDGHPTYTSLRGQVQ